jgi:hypothetical protein
METEKLFSGTFLLQKRYICEEQIFDERRMYGRKNVFKQRQKKQASKCFAFVDCSIFSLVQQF